MRVKPLTKAATIKLTLKESSWGKVGWLLARLRLMWAHAFGPSLTVVSAACVWRQLKTNMAACRVSSAWRVEARRKPSATESVNSQA